MSGADDSLPTGSRPAIRRTVEISTETAGNAGAPMPIPDARSRTERARADATKSGGVHYTPPDLASLLARSALAEHRQAKRIRVLDPACGDGALLAAVVECASDCEFELVGCDRDEQALAAARSRLRTATAASVDFRLELCDFLEVTLKHREARRSLFGAEVPDWLAEPFDVVIANPPYVRTQTLGADESQQLAAAFGLSGRVDLYHAFALAMAQALADDGTLALLCSNRFMTTKSGKGLRRYLAEQLTIRSVLDLGDTKLFDAAVLPAIVIASRSPSDEVPAMTSVYEAPAAHPAPKYESVPKALEQGAVGTVSIGSTVFDVRRGVLRRASVDAPWVLTAEADRWVEQVDTQAAMRFADLGKIRVGIKTTADRIFIRDDWTSLQEPTPEAELLLPLITHHVANRWQSSQTERRVLYPYDLNQPKRTPLDLNRWPLTMAYFDAHRHDLEKRRYVTEAGRHWWEIWVPQRPSEWSLPKLVFPDISEEPRFFLDRSGAVVNGDCYWLALPTKTEESLGLLAMAIANSTLGTRYYDCTCGNKLYSGRRRYITQYVERFPLPDPDSPEAHKIVGLVHELSSGQAPAVDRLQIEHEIDALVWRSFGIEEVPR